MELHAVGNYYYYYDSESASMKVSFILLGWSCANDFTMSFIFSSDGSSLQQSRLIFIRANPLSLLLVIVERWLVLISFMQLAE